MGIGDWGLGIGDWGLGIGDWAQSPIPNPQSPIPNPQSPKIKILLYLDLNRKKLFIFIYSLKKNLLKYNCIKFLLLVQLHFVNFSFHIMSA